MPPRIAPSRGGPARGGNPPRRGRGGGAGRGSLSGSPPRAAGEHNVFLLVYFRFDEWNKLSCYIYDNCFLLRP